MGKVGKTGDFLETFSIDTLPTTTTCSSSERIPVSNIFGLADGESGAKNSGIKAPLHLMRPTKKRVLEKVIDFVTTFIREVAASSMASLTIFRIEND